MQLIFKMFRLMYYIHLFLLFNLVFVCTTASSSVFRTSRNVKKSIIEEDKCKEIKLICDSLNENDDLSVLECLLSTNPSRLSNLSEDCQHIIWEHRRKIITEVKDTLLPSCQNFLNNVNCESGSSDNYLKCILNSVDNIRSAECHQMVLRLENVAFTDYLWISGFLQHCTEDITALKCGRIDPQNFLQLKTITCLQNNILNVKDECKQEVFHLTELQSDSVKLDSQLYLDCAYDSTRYCSQFLPGSGKVFSCLMQQMHKGQTELAPKCKQHLLRRQKLITQDYQISKGLLKACKEDIKKTHCRKQVSDDKTVRLAHILLCLENSVKNGTQINSDCKDEMIEHRRMLMEDFRLSPEIVDNCKNEIIRFCKGFEYGGKTIHCLMDHALREPANSRNSRIQDKCMRALEDLVEETDVGENWSIDPVLHQACDPVVKDVCKGVQGGDSRVMSCLMDKIGTDYMNEDCESALIQIQYFVARDFKLDPQLYRECKKDAIKHCHVNDDSTQEGPSYSRQVLPCLYRHAYLLQDDLKLEKICLQQIRRVMRQRAINVDLQPEIEEACLEDLGSLCLDKFKKGEEMQCLQENLEDLDDRCHDVVESFTEIQAEHVDLNPYIIKYCNQIIGSLCKSQLSDDEGDIMDCLIENKNSPQIKSNRPCRASIDHFQIISLKDYRFTYKFKVACKTHAVRLCSHAKSKNEVITCLSEQLLNSTIRGVKSSISKDCKQQLKAQIFQQRENIEYDPVLKLSCSAEIKKYCSKFQPGDSQVLECLQTIPQEKLSKKCAKEIFKVQQLEIYDNTVDYALLTMCADAIDKFCSNYDKEAVLDCLKMNKEDKDFNKKCKTIVTHRMIEQNTNYLLNPALQENCDLDISKYCKDELVNDSQSVIKCLKRQFKLWKLSNKCEKGMAEILREEALNVDLNPLIKVVCKNELETICKFDEEHSRDVEECLKTSLIKKNIATPECQLEVANMIEESQADIQVDPILQSACAFDLLTYCNNVPQGNGRHIQCLKNKMISKDLTSKCKNKLKERLEMYKNAVQVLPLSDLRELYRQVVLSPSKNDIVIFLFVIIGGVFVIGVLCGQITRNKYRLLRKQGL